MLRWYNQSRKEHVPGSGWDNQGRLSLHGGMENKHKIETQFIILSTVGLKIHKSISYQRIKVF